MKQIGTLVDDIYSVINDRGGWDETVNEFFKEDVGQVMLDRLSKGDQPRGNLRMSSMGTPCKRKLWYSVNEPDEGEPLPVNARLKFLYGDILESLLISLALAAGHRVEGIQSVLEIAGIKGHRDCVINGVTVDVKSASPFSFKKFKDGGLRSDDPFGYISQLSSYVYGGRDDPIVEDKQHGAFLVIDKVHGHLCLDLHDLSEDIANKEQEFEDTKAMVLENIPDRTFEPVPQSKTSPNMKLGINCSYCDYKKLCWPDMRTFIYSSGPLFLVHVETEPKVPEEGVVYV